MADYAVILMGNEPNPDVPPESIEAIGRYSLDAFGTASDPFELMDILSSAVIATAKTLKLTNDQFHHGLEILWRLAADIDAVAKEADSVHDS